MYVFRLLGGLINERRKERIYKWIDLLEDTVCDLKAINNIHEYPGLLLRRELKQKREISH